MIINVIITAYKKIDNVNNIIDLLVKKSNSKIKFIFTIGIYNNNLNNFNGELVTKISLDRNMFWAESVKHLLLNTNKINADYYLHINEDVILNEVAINEYINKILKNENDVIYGYILNKNENLIIFGLVKFKYGYKPMPIQQSYYDMELGDAFHGNFFSFKKNLCDLILDIPKYKHAYFDYHFSIMIKRMGYRVAAIHEPVSYTNETIDDRNKIIKSNNGIFSKSRNNIKDKFLFFKFKSGLIFSLIICATQLIKLKKY
jgi:hypothetical protein